MKHLKELFNHMKKLGLLKQYEIYDDYLLEQGFEIEGEEIKQSPEAKKDYEDFKAGLKPEDKKDFNNLFGG